jgi:hypothetical protein
MEDYTMPISQQELNDLLQRPTESLSLEVKQWFDPASDDGTAKIAKGCMALRNQNGGYMVIGFADDGTPDTTNLATDVRAVFHVDIIQRIVGQFSSEPFPVQVQFGERDGTLYPVICVPSGVRVPVVAKRDLGPPDKRLIKDHAVYVRSLRSNNTVSSSEARRGDWERLRTILCPLRDCQSKSIGSKVGRADQRTPSARPVHFRM